MSFDKVEVRVFSGPDQVQVGSNTEPDLIVMNIGPKGDTGATGNTGATGPAGPNSVTSATTSDGTGQIMLDTLAVGICNILDEVVFDTLTYTFAEGSAQALKDAIQIASADITDASTVPVYNETTELYEEVAALYDGEGAINAVNFYSQGAFQSFDGDNYASFIVSDTPISWLFGTKQFSIKEPLGNGGQCTIPDASGTFALTSAANGEPDKLTAGTISGATTFNTTSYIYGTGAAAAHRTALGLTTLATTTPAANVANFLEFPTSANLASALTDENGTGGGFVRAEGATLTSPSIDGTAAFTGTTRPTSAGTGTPAATSLMTRDDVALEPFYNLGSVFRVSATPAFANSGTGSSSATQSAGDRWAGLSSGTANSGWARAQIGRGLTTVPSLSGAGINFASKLGVSIVLWIANSAATDNLNIFRLRFGSDNTPVADGVDAVAYRGFGVEIKARGSSHDWRVYGHNGTSITYSAWSNTGLGTDILRIRIFLSVMSNGSGTITASLGVNGSRTLSTITTTGGPTTTGTSAQSFIEVHVANSASGTLPLAAALYDAMFYAQT
jgi:hypothetical protein